jgi:hypothetical protein
LVKYRYFNKFHWNFGRRFPDNGSYPETWSVSELELPSCGKGWVNYLTLNMGDRYTEIGIRYSVPCLQPDFMALYYHLRKSCEGTDLNILRTQLDGYIKVNVDGLWNHVYDTIMRHGNKRKTAIKEANIARQEFEKPYL